MNCIWIATGVALIVGVAAWLCWRDWSVDDDVNTDFLTDWDDEL